ncbi:hypothetical protein NA78x_001147 [Anatilimnocola sp. NA78]|uniref:hypothetical protein n=1 Tax=Anatilimnocola sp. NA78 TaxID=3415683 RepID=UPI003CE4F20D
MVIKWFSDDRQNDGGAAAQVLGGIRLVVIGYREKSREKVIKSGCQNGGELAEVNSG